MKEWKNTSYYQKRMSKLFELKFETKETFNFTSKCCSADGGKGYSQNDPRVGFQQEKRF